MERNGIVPTGPAKQGPTRHGYLFDSRYRTQVLGHLIPGSGRFVLVLSNGVQCEQPFGRETGGLFGQPVEGRHEQAGDE